MKKITLVYTGLGTVASDIDRLYKEVLGPEVKLNHIIDSGLIWELAESGMTPRLKRRLTALYDAAAATDPDLIIGSCSSIGAFTESYAEEHPELNLLRIDYPMAKLAAERGKKVVVMATLETTVRPSLELLRRLAAQSGRELESVGVTVPGAIDALMAGKPREATELVVRSARENCRGADMVILAQASMALFKDAIHEVLDPGAQILESPSTCADYLKSMETRG